MQDKKESLTYTRKSKIASLCQKQRLYWPWVFAMTLFRICHVCHLFLFCPAPILFHYPSDVLHGRVWRKAKPKVLLFFNRFEPFYALRVLNNLQNSILLLWSLTLGKETRPLQWVFNGLSVNFHCFFNTVLWHFSSVCFILI